MTLIREGNRRRTARPARSAALLVALVAGCQWVAGIDDRSAGPSNAGAAPGSGASGGSSGAATGAGGSGDSSAGGEGSVDGGTSATGGGAPNTGGSGTVQCLAAQFVDESPVWSVAEGDEAGTSLDLGLVLVDSEPAEWSVELVGAPQWIAAPSSLIEGTSLELEASQGVPYDAAPGGSFDVRLELKADPDCIVEVSVELDVENVLYTPPVASDLPEDITWAAWHSLSQRFFLLDSTAQRYFVVDTTERPPTVSDAIALPASGTVAPLGLAVSNDTLFAIIDDTVYRMTLAGEQQGPAIPLASPAPSGALTMAWAGGWLLVADGGGPMRALEDDAADLEASTFLDWDSAKALTSDGGSFAFRISSDELRRLQPSTWDSAACTVSSESNGVQLSGEQVAWLTTSVPAVHYATLTTSCSGEDSISLPDVAEFYQPLGIANGRALVIEGVTGGPPRKVDLALYDLESGEQVAAPLLDQTIAGTEFGIRMGDLKFALVITASGTRKPLLVQL
jgi:hypothetical protein